MLRSKKIGLVVWGTILFVISVVLFAIPEEFTTVIGLFILAGAILMMVFGVLNIVSVTKYNNILLSDNENVEYHANCTFCGREIQCTIREFRPHGRFPEGFVYCPVCKNPVSRNAFNAFRRQDAGVNYGMNEFGDNSENNFY